MTQGCQKGYGKLFLAARVNHAHRLGDSKFRLLQTVPNSYCGTEYGAKSFIEPSQGSGGAETAWNKNCACRIQSRVFTEKAGFVNSLSFEISTIFEATTLARVTLQTELTPKWRNNEVANLEAPKRGLF